MIILYFDLCLSVMLDSLSVSFTFISFLTKGRSIKNNYVKSTSYGIYLSYYFICLSCSKVKNNISYLDFCLID